MYKIIINESPDYLTEMLPNTVGETNRHNLRNSPDFVILFKIMFISNIILSINFKIME